MVWKTIEGSYYYKEVQRKESFSHLLPDNPNLREIIEYDASFMLSDFILLKILVGYAETENIFSFFYPRFMAGASVT